MDLKLTQVRLLVTAYEACFFFYRDTLGFSVGYGSEHEDYASFRTDNAVVALYKRPLMAEVVGTVELPVEAESQDRVVLHFQVDSVDQTVELLREGGGYRAGTDQPAHLGIAYCPLPRSGRDVDRDFPGSCVDTVYYQERRTNGTSTV